MKAFVERRIRDREEQLAAIDTQMRLMIEQAKELEIELRAYRDVLANEIGSPDAFADESSKDVLVENQEESGSADHLKTRMSDTWKSILRQIAFHYPSPIDMDTIRFIAQNENAEISNESLRSQLSTYTSRRWLERTSFGKYRITHSGARIIGYKFSPEQTNEIFKTGGGAANTQQNPVM